MDVTATEETRAHYQRPEVREIITRYAIPGDGADGAWRALNGDFSWWYHNEGNIQRLLNIDDYDQIINQVRTLYQSLNVFWQPLRFGWRDYYSVMYGSIILFHNMYPCPSKCRPS